MHTADPAPDESSEVTPRATSPIQVTRSSMSSSVSGTLGMVTGNTRSQETSQLTSVTLEVRIFSKWDRLRTQDTVIYLEARVKQMLCNGRGTDGRVRMTPGQENWYADILETLRRP